MSRAKEINYNPAWTVKENAKRNGVSEPTIRNYIKNNLIDRRYDRKQNIIADCRKLYKKNPKITRNEIQQKTGHSLSTIRKYWKYISTEAELTDFNNEKIKKRQLRQLNNFYATHPSVTEDILREEKFYHFILEPFCGSGTMAKVIEQKGYDVRAYDIVNRGYGLCCDFLKLDISEGHYDIITNPPYDENLNEYILKALRIAKTKVALLLPLNYLSGEHRAQDIFLQTPPSRVYVYTGRIGIAKNGDFSQLLGNKVNYSWYVWDKDYKGDTELKWITNGRGSKPKAEKTVKANGYEFWSEVLKSIPEMLQRADDTDVSGLRDFFNEKPEMPMLFIGSGGQNGAVPAFLYGLNKGVGRALTPLQFASLSDEAVKNSRIMLLSKSGGNDDIKYASERAAKLNPENTACITFNDTPDNALIKNLRGTSAKIFLYNSGRTQSGFTSVCGKFFKYGLYYRAFTGSDTISNLVNVNLSTRRCFKIELNKAPDEPVNLEKVEHLCVLYGGYGEPVAQDLESVMTESGLASVQVCDYRNYCHGRFIFPTNHTANDKEPRGYTNVAMVLLVSPRERNLAQKIRNDAVPSRTPVITIETEEEYAVGLIDLLVKSNVFIGYFGEQVKRINPYSPPNYHADDVDKRKPINIKFIEDLRQSGNLLLTESPEAAALGKEIGAIVTVEQSNTDYIRENFSRLPLPTREDLFSGKEEHYDASKYLCFAFRRRGDLHKEMAMPFGNMNGGFGYKINGVYFHTSESAYICGMFSNNTPEHRAIQEALVAETNGKLAKGDIRYHNEAIGRDDWYEFNIDWMLYCIWQKVKGNEDFRISLAKIPSGATIIENTTFQARHKNDTAAFWGCRNAELKSFDNLLKKYAACKGWNKAQTEEYVTKQENLVCNYGEFVGNNVMGKILTIVKRCLHEGREPDIDYDLLRRKNIYLLGEKLTFKPIKPKRHRL